MRRRELPIAVAGLLLGMLAALACAPPYRAVRLATARDSWEAEHRVGTFRGVGGQKLFYQSWHPRSAARAALIIVHGLKDHSSRYDVFARELTGRGFAVYALDLRGHGRSAGRRVAVAKFDDYVADVASFVALARKAETGSLFLFGHSMGGTIAAVYVATREHELAGLILSGPALALDRWPITIALTRLTGALMANLPALRLPNENFSSNPDTVRDMGKDPLVYQDAGPAGTAAELANGIETAWAHVDRFSLPLLLLHGSQDRLTHPKGTRLLHDSAPSTDKTFHLYEGFWHDLLHEPGRERISAEIAAWLEAHSPSAN